MKKILNNKGVTLVELLVVVAILGLVMVTVVNLFSYSMNAYKNDDVEWQIQQEARTALQIITREVRANSISSSTETEVELKDGSGAAETIQFGTLPSGKKGLAIFKNGTYQLIAEDIKSVQFTYDNKVLTVNITAKKPDFDKEYKLSANIYSRID